MSPEQARGLPVDTRTDIWAFGCALYEMLAGRKAFNGRTATDCFAAIVGRDPDWTILPPSVPENVVRVMQRCLSKDLEGRLADMDEVRRELDDALAATTVRMEGTPAARSTRRRASVLTYAASIAVTWRSTRDLAGE